MFPKFWSRSVARDADPARPGRIGTLRALLAALMVANMLVFTGGMALAQQEGRERPQPFETPAPAATLPPGVTPTVDRLAPPPTVESPTQADEGAYLYWLHCMPCHGDVGQGLTEEFRIQYPHEDQNCWESGCHGDRPYDNGFTLPTAVPAVIGEDTLTRFQTLGTLYTFTQASMPYWNPNSLTEQEYLALTAFMARANGYWDGEVLTAANVHEMMLPFADSITDPTVPPAGQETGGDFTSTPMPVTPAEQFTFDGLLTGILLLAALAATGGLVLWNRRGK